MGTPSDAPKPGIAAPAAVGRRRLIKAGAAAVPVAATLVSRPAFAWHGKTPSAWGSEQLNPNSSLQANNPGVVDETWILSNWIRNESRAGLGQPWNRLAAVAGVQVGRSADWYKAITLKQLFTTAGSSLVVPSGASGLSSSATCVVTWLMQQGNSFAAVMLVAQLNRILLSSVQKIVTAEQLQQMARLSFTPKASGQTSWDQNKIKDYLDQNYIVRTS